MGTTDTTKIQKFNTSQDHHGHGNNHGQVVIVSNLASIEHYDHEGNYGQPVTPNYDHNKDHNPPMIATILSGNKDYDCDDDHDSPVKVYEDQNLPFVFGHSDKSRNGLIVMMDMA